MKLTVNIREKKIKGLVKPKGEGSVFRDSLLKGRTFLFIRVLMDRAGPLWAGHGV